MAKKAANAQESGSQEESTPEKVFINIDTSDEDVLRYMEEGCFLVFEHEKDHFKVLSQEIVEKMDPITRGSYRASEALNANHSPEADEFAKKFQVIGSGAPAAGPLERFENVELKAGLTKTWARPDMHTEMLAKGWVPASKSHVKSHLAHDVEGHVEIKTGMGTTDSILYVKDEKLRKEDLMRRDRERRDLGKQIENAGQEAVLGTGYQPIVK